VEGAASGLAGRIEHQNSGKETYLKLARSNNATLQKLID